MPTIGGALTEALSSRSLSVTHTPFAPERTIVKRASFPKGVTPGHLAKYSLSKGNCAGRKGVVSHQGRLIPASAACVAEGRGARRMAEA